VKLEFFENGLDGEPLILLYGGTADEARQLRDAIAKLAESSERQLAIHDLAFVEAIRGIAVTAVSGERDEGVRSVGPEAFLWTLSSNAWSEINELLDPFTLYPNTEHASFQYLNPSNGPEVIYSTDRKW
jgi:hypothetical protein